IERVLADVEVEGREVVNGEIEQCMEDALEVEFVVARAHRLIELGEAGKHITLEPRHLGVRDREAWMMMGEIAEQEPERGPKLSIRLPIPPDDLPAAA